MSQAISALSLGALVAVQENDQYVPYQVAGKNVHGSNTVTLVRRDGYGPGMQWYPVYSTQVYNQSTLDQFMRDFESKYTVLHRAELINTAINYYIPSSPNSETILRKVFALSLTEVGGGANGGISENAHLPLYANDAARIKSSVPAYGWWLRSVRPTSEWLALRVASDGRIGISYYRYKYESDVGPVPAHVVRSSLLVSSSPNISGYYDVIYPDSTPGKPVLIAPVNVYADVDSPIVFNWQHVNASGTPQTKADLQYSSEGGEWQTLAAITGSAASYTVPDGSLLPGDLRWRARTYNTDNTAGDWSDPAAFIGVGLPQAPSISGVSASSRPTINWGSAGQEGYQLQLLHDEDAIFDTGEVAGTEKKLVLPMYLANGVYVVRIRIINASLLWSGWSEYEFTLAVTPPDAPTVTVAPITNGARISVSNIDESIAHLYLLRNGVPVADITGLEAYDDYAGLGVTEYIARAVDGDENYADSSPVEVDVAVIGAALAAADDLSGIIRMKQKSAGQPAVTGQEHYVGAGHHYAGREHVVYTFSEFKDESYSASYYYHTGTEEWAQLKALADRRRTVLYRDTLGNRFYGAAVANNYTQDEDKVVFALSIQRVDYVEQIPYAEVEEA